MDQTPGNSGLSSAEHDDENAVEVADETFDVVVVGGGAAGLSGALALGRARRSVLVVDAGEPRNAPAGHVHNYLGSEGTPPADLLRLGRAEVLQYGVDVRTGTVTGAEPVDGGFTVRLADGRVVRCRRLLVTTGLVDELPDVPGLADGWGRDVLHCPYCHGWEVRDRALGVLGTSPVAVHQALLFRQWTADLTLLRHTGFELTDDEREQLAARGVAVVEGPVVQWGDGCARLAPGQELSLDALVVAPVFTARAAVLEQLGLTAVPVEYGGHVLGSQVPSDATGLTAVPGVWVAGNVTDVRAQVIASAAGGLAAGAAINADLVAEDTRLAVERLRMFGEAAWDARYRQHAHAIWSGRPNAVLVDEVSELPVGRALDVGCGEGADAIWLAGRGWQVTAVDLSTVALARASEHAASAGVQVDWTHADLLTAPPAALTFDLVTSHFLHLATADRAPLYAALAEAVAPGGTLLLVGHHPLDLRTTIGRPALPDLLFTAEQLAAPLDRREWDVVVTEARPRTATDAEHRPVTVHDAVLRARRR
jgi:thioredoxin reductase/SAM-dependent methyltransferase